MEQLSRRVQEVAAHHAEKERCAAENQKVFSREVMQQNYIAIYHELQNEETK